MANVQTFSKGDTPGWISTRTRNAQIINPSAYHPTIARDRVLDPAAKIRKQAQVIRQKLSSDDINIRHMSIDGIKYSVQSGGSKLVRIKGLSPLPGKENFIEAELGPNDSTLSTPKQVTVSGIQFLRSKNGNLYRSTVVKRNWYGRENCDAMERKLKKQRRNSTGAGITGKSSALCKRFANTGKSPSTRFRISKRRLVFISQLNQSMGMPADLYVCLGSCSHGPACPYIHDTTKLAVCRNFLKLGTCSQGQHCDLSHDLTYERVPACMHFVRGGCNKDNEQCPYPHVRTNPAAPLCRAFTTFGYCSKGIECKDKHAFECPDYAEGKCSAVKCRLPHVDRAGQLRQQQQHHTQQQTLDTLTDVDSEDEVMIDVEGGFSQEQDFFRF